jgi:fatty acid synthase subunit beta, fungi type
MMPSRLYCQARRLEDAFKASLTVESAKPLPFGHKPASTFELVALYIGFVATEVGENQQAVEVKEVLRVVLNEFEQAIMHADNVHAVVASLPIAGTTKNTMVQCYYAGCAAAGHPIKQYDSVLLRAAKYGEASIFTIFGGQGLTEAYFEELRDIYTIYPSFTTDLVTTSNKLLHNLVRHPKAQKFYDKGLDILGWLEDREMQPDTKYLVSAPVSFPLIGLVQLAHYQVTCKILGKTPGEVNRHINGSTGHSQGLVTAAIIATTSSWESFAKAAQDVITILFWIGMRSQQVCPVTVITSDVQQDSNQADEVSPSPMLSIQGLPIEKLEEQIKATNQHLPNDRHVAISLTNSSTYFVITGSPASLYNLHLRLREFKETDLDQDHLTPIKHKPQFVSRFLPITAPFHSHLLVEAYNHIVEDLAGIRISAARLTIPVFETKTGKSLQCQQDKDIVPCLVRMVTTEPLNWERATVFEGVSHIIDFGPGGTAGVGLLTHGNKKTSGVRVIVAGVISGTNNEVGYKPEIFDYNKSMGGN